MSARDLAQALARRHEEINRRTASEWERFTPHRERVTSLVQSTGRSGRLCVLGAGNCNDLDLAALAGQFDELVLVDVDAGAVARACARADAATRARLRVFAPVDASGVIASWEAWNGRAPREEDLRALPEVALAHVLAALPFESDVVLSAGVWSQLLVTAEQALGRGHPALGRVATAMQLAHLAAMARLTSRAGAALLVTDSVSSAWFPLPQRSSPLACLVAMDGARTAGRLIPGTDPSYLRLLLERDPLLSPLVGGVTFHAPWAWAIDEGLLTIAYAAAFERR